MSDALQRIVDLADRHYLLAILHPECPKCGSERVYLISCTMTTAKWRCRECKTRFEES